MEKISLNLSAMKFMLYGDAENEPKEVDISRLVDDLFTSNLLLDLLVHMREFEFEARKDVARVYDFVLRQRKAQSLEYVKSHQEILKVLVEGYTDSEVALNCGSILREVIRHEELNDLVLNSALFDLFFDYVQLSTFDIASDAFATFKLMLTKHKVLCAKFLDSHYDDFVTKYNVLLQSRNYVTKRQSLKLLGELLLNRSNFSVMMRYINSADNLKIMMNLLRGNTKAIQFEAFHVFKIFVANPKKSAAVVEILVRNKKKLMEFLHKFQKEKEDDQFNEEKNTLLMTLNALPDPQVGGEGDEEKKEGE
jgi:calcium binding protein 39